MLDDLRPEVENSRMDLSVISPSEKKDTEINYVYEITNVVNGARERWFAKQVNKVFENTDLTLKFRKRGVVPKDKREVESILNALSQIGQVFQEENEFIYVLGERFILSFNFFSRKENVCYSVNILTGNLEDREWVNSKIEEIFGNSDEILCPIEMYIKNNRGQIMNVSMEEKIDDVIHEESYPFLNRGKVNEYIDNYLNSRENVLILLGDAGTGKTRLIRHILRTAINKGQGLDNSGFSSDIYDGERYKIFYTTSKDVLDSDELFSRFISEHNAILVLEDIDFHLRSRAEDNPLMYKLLASSDGLISSHNKIIISTNVDSENKIDEALIRPGRCFNLAKFRKLSIDEANAVLEKLECKDRLQDKRNYNLSEVYRFANTGRLDNQEEDEIRVKPPQKAGFF